MTDQQQVLAVCVDVGETLLSSGGEIFRVQETMERIARAFGACDFHVYVLTNGLFASVHDAGETRSSEVRHIPVSTVHMGRIIAVNALSREIEAGTLSPVQALQRVAEIRALPYKSTRLRIFACGIGAGCFAYLFGGGVLGGIAAFGTGLVLQMFCMLLLKKKVSKIIYNILAAGFVAVSSVVLTQILGAFGIVAQTNSIIIGSIIPLVPGMALTTSIRDFANGDYLSGTIRLMDALLVASSIAMGVGAVLAVTAYLPGVVV